MLMYICLVSLLLRHTPFSFYVFSISSTLRQTLSSCMSVFLVSCLDIPFHTCLVSLMLRQTPFMHVFLVSLMLRRKPLIVGLDPWVQEKSYNLALATSFIGELHTFWFRHTYLWFQKTQPLVQIILPRHLNTTFPIQAIMFQFKQVLFLFLLLMFK